MRVADYIWKFLADKGVCHVFLVTGGGAMHLNDALGREARIKYVCNLHEQACAMAAEGPLRAGSRGSAWSDQCHDGAGWHECAYRCDGRMA